MAETNRIEYKQELTEILVSLMVVQKVVQWVVQ